GEEAEEVGRIIYRCAVLEDQVLSRLAPTHIKSGGKFPGRAYPGQSGETSDRIDLAHKRRKRFDDLDIEPLNAGKLALHIHVDTFGSDGYALELSRFREQADVNAAGGAEGTETYD